MPRKTKKKLQYYEAIGRRKSATARVRLYIVDAGQTLDLFGSKVKKGEMLINKRPVADYFPGPVAKTLYQKPLILTDTLDRFAVLVLIGGGGARGQLDAVVHGMARALQKADEQYRPVLKKEGLLTRDARVKERRKVGTGGRARRKKQSPKR